MSAVFIVTLIVGIIIGVVAGFFRKFTKTSFWGITVIIALLFERMIGTSVKKDSKGYGLAVILTTVIVLLVLSAVLLALQKLLEKAVKARKKFSEYQNYDDRAEADALILNAVDNNDKREYKRQLKKRKKIKDSAGVWGVLDRIFGCVSGGLNALAGVGAVIVFVVIFADLSSISAVKDALSSQLSSPAWKETGMAVALDLPLVCALALSIRIGYKGGITSVISIVVVFGLVVGFAVAAWSIASSEACAGTVAALNNGVLKNLSGTLGGASDKIAQGIIALIIFALSLIVVILVAVFLPKVMEKLREIKAFKAVDGVLGALLTCAVVTMLLLVVGGIAYTLHDLEFVAQFNKYARRACLGDGFYSCNPMGSSFEGVPLRNWFNKQ